MKDLEEQGHGVCAGGCGRRCCRVGWRQAVALGCGCLNNSIAFMVPMSLNTLFLDWQTSFLTDRGATASVQAVAMGAITGGGLIAGMLDRKLGERVSMMVGGFLSTVGFFAGGFADSLPVLIVCAGAIAGGGASMLNLSNLSSVLRRFRNRAGFVASTMALVSGLVMLAGPFLTRYLADQYTWRGCLILASGITLQVLPASILLTSPLLEPARAPGGTPTHNPDPPDVETSRQVSSPCVHQESGSDDQGEDFLGTCDGECSARKSDLNSGSALLSDFNTKDRTGLGPNTKDRTGLGPNTKDRTGLGPNTKDRTGLGPNTKDRTGLGPNTKDRRGLGPNTKDRTGLGPNVVTQSGRNFAEKSSPLNRQLTSQPVPEDEDGCTTDGEVTESDPIPTLSLKRLSNDRDPNSVPLHPAVLESRSDHERPTSDHERPTTDHERPTTDQDSLLVEDQHGGWEEMRNGQKAENGDFLNTRQGESHTHQGESHTHQGESHTHQGESHTHQGESHTHQGESHTRQGESHTRQAPHKDTGMETNSGEHTTVPANRGSSEELTNTESSAQTTAGRLRKWAHLLQFLSNPLYLAVTLSITLKLGVVNAFVFLVLDFAGSRGWSQEEGLFLNFIFMTANLVSRLVAVLVSLSPRDSCVALMMAAGIIGGLASCLLGQASDYRLAGCVFGCLGMTLGLAISMFSPCVLLGAGAHHYPLAVGLCLTLTGLSIITLTRLTGFLVDLQGSYTPVSLIYGIAMFLAEGLLFFIYRRCRPASATSDRH